MRLDILKAIGILVLVASVCGSRKSDVGKRAKDKSPDRRDKSNLEKKKSLNDVLGLDSRNSFKLVRSIKTIRGTKKMHAQQMYEGLEVFGAGAVYSVDENDDFTESLSGEIVEGIEEDIADLSVCMIDDHHLLVIGMAIAGIHANSVHCSLKKSHRIIYFDESNLKATIAHIIELYDSTPNKESRPYIIVAACDNTVYFNVDRMSKRPVAWSSKGKTQRSKFPSVNNLSSHLKREVCHVDALGTGGNLRTGDRVYGTVPFCLNVQRSNSTCTLESSVVKVVDLHQSWYRNQTSPYSYDCISPDDAINGANSANLDALFYGETVYNVFQSEYNMAPLNFKLLMYVHFGVRYENAFWDGTSMTFGDGDTNLYPLVSLDILAHEVAHGITEQNSNLLYSKQSGGISEAFSDITGEAVKKLASFHAQADPPVPNDWMVGAEVAKNVEAFRFFDDPTRDGRSIGHIKDYNFEMNVHYSSGIYNKAFYELVVTQGVAMVDAYGCFLDANKVYWGTKTGFVDGACGVKAAAIGRGVDASKINAAFLVVGIYTSCCGVDSLDTLPLDILSLTVSEKIILCYVLLPRKGKRRQVAIKASSTSGEVIKIKILSGKCESLVTSKDTSIIYTLPKWSENVVCFSAGTEVSDVTVTARYCKHQC